jgi:hypothetical protein
MTTTLQTWRGFWRRSRSERKVALQAAAVLLATRPGLRLVGFRRWQNALAKHTPEPTREAHAKDSSSIEMLAGHATAISIIAEAVARRLPFEPTCLEKSLTLWWLLRRHRILADLRIGVRKETAGFEAHAWVESAGEVLSESRDEHQHFVPFEGAIDSLETQLH